MDILAVLIARKYKAEHPEEFGKRHAVENIPVKANSSEGPNFFKEDLEAA